MYPVVPGEGPQPDRVEILERHLLFDAAQHANAALFRAARLAAQFHAGHVMDLRRAELTLDAPAHPGIVAEEVKRRLSQSHQRADLLTAAVGENDVARTL